MLPALFMNSLRQCLVGGGELVYAGSAGAIFHHLRSDRRFNPPGGACSSIWLEPAAHNRLVGGSSPSGPTIFVLSDPVVRQVDVPTVVVFVRQKEFWALNAFSSRISGIFFMKRSKNL